MALQNQPFAAPIPTATLSSAFYASSDLISLSVVASNEGPSYENYYDGQTTANDAPPGLTYTVQRALSFGNYLPGYSLRSGEVKYNLWLAADGCRQSNQSSEDAVYNCSIACVNPKDIFTHTPTMANCMAYGLIVDALISGNVSDSFKQTAMKYGITANRTTAAQVESKILLCFNQCKDAGACGYGGGYTSSYYHPDNATLTLYYQVSDMCVGVIAPVVTDIAGIGVGTLVRSHERHKLTISARSISHTGSKTPLRSRLLVYSNCTTFGFTTLSFLLSSGAEVTQELAALRFVFVGKPKSVLFHALLLRWWSSRKPSATSCWPFRSLR